MAYGASSASMQTGRWSTKSTYGLFGALAGAIITLLWSRRLFSGYKGETPEPVVPHRPNDIDYPPAP